MAENHCPKPAMVRLPFDYESIETLQKLEGLVDVYLPDLKYLGRDISQRYSGAGDYPEVATAAIMEMYRQVGDTIYNSERILQKGMIIRHLILPNNVDNSFDVIDWIADSFRKKRVLVSLMAQYTPIKNVPAEISRPISQEEYERVMSYFSLSGIEDGFTQELSCASAEYIPEFY